jgi:hypothetical protein
MKLLTFFVLFMASTAFANPSQKQLDRCEKKAKKLIAATAEAAGLGKGVSNMGGLDLVTSNGLADGTIYGVLGGGPLASEDSDGYITGASASVAVIFSGKDCKIVGITLRTGAILDEVK